MTLVDIVARRRDALLKSWIRDPLILVQVESPQSLQRLVFLDDAGGGAVGALGRRNAQNVAVVRDAANPDTNSSLWVAAKYADYKAAYLSFIDNLYGLKAMGAELAGYDVDHLLNRARSPEDSTFIRVEAVPSDANQAWGRLFEKAASDPRFFANTRRERRTMSWIICAKLAGQMPPYGPGDSSGIGRLVDFFVLNWGVSIRRPP